jgi:hypothetical protein
LELGEDALRALCGFVQEGRPEPDDPHGLDPAEQEAQLRRAVEAMGPPRVYAFGLDGSPVSTLPFSQRL